MNEETHSIENAPDASDAEDVVLGGIPLDA
jgi:hypothetical protein